MAANNTTKPDLLRKRKLVGLAVFTMIIVVLQILCTFVRFSPFSITLALVPVIIGAAVYGSASGAYLGFVMGLVVLYRNLRMGRRNHEISHKYQLFCRRGDLSAEKHCRRMGFRRCL